MVSIIKQNLKHHKVIRNNTVPVDQCASVLIVLRQTNDSDDIQVLLTLRSANLRTHAGEVAFPGGRQEANESSLECALREAEEEVGLKRDDVEIIGELEQITARMNILVTPFVAVLTPSASISYEPIVCQREVAEVFWISLSDFMNDQNHTAKEIVWGNYNYMFHVYSIGGKSITGLTASLMLRLLCVGLEYAPPYPLYALHGPSWIDIARTFHHSAL